MLVRPMLLHRMALVCVRLFCKYLGNLQEFFGQMVYRPPPPPDKKLPVGLCPRARFGDRQNSFLSFIRIVKCFIILHTLP